MYDIVLKEKRLINGLSKTEVIALFDKLDAHEAYPIEIYAKTQESSAMGFISQKGAEKIDYDYKESGLQDFIAAILDDMRKESENCEYEFRNMKIWLSR